MGDLEWALRLADYSGEAFSSFQRFRRGRAYPKNAHQCVRYGQPQEHAGYPTKCGTPENAVQEREARGRAQEHRSENQRRMGYLHINLFCNFFSKKQTNFVLLNSAK